MKRNTVYRAYSLIIFGPLKFLISQYLEHTQTPSVFNFLEIIC